MTTDRRIVLDASVLVDVLGPSIDPSEDGPVAVRRLLSSGVTFVGPKVLHSEVRNALLTGIRRRRWDGIRADQAVERLDRFPVAVFDHFPDVARAWELARRHDNHPIYDMVYVAMAERLGLRLLTQDSKLKRKLAQPELILLPGEVGDD